jgi:hypothetical protein
MDSKKHILTFLVVEKSNYQGVLDGCMEMIILVIQGIKKDKQLVFEINGEGKPVT